MATTMHQGRKAIATTGTAVALASAQEVTWLVCFAPFMNKGPIFVGSSTVTGAGSTTATTDGYVLMPGANTPPGIGPCDLAEVYIEGKAGDCVYWVAGSGTSTGGITVVQATAANLNATVVQGTAANLQATVTQATPIGAPVEDVTIYLVGADLTTDGIAYSDVTETVTANTDVTIYEYTFEPESGGGTLLWLYFNIVATLKAQSATADLKMTMEIRDKDGTWQTLFTQVTYADINTTYLDKRYEGYLVKDATAYCTPGDADLWTYLTEVPFDFRVLLQSNETAAASGRGYGKIKNSSLIRAVYNTE